MANDLAQKISRLIGNVRSVHKLVNAIPHELERQALARLTHLKIDALVKLLPQLKNILKKVETGGSSAVVHLEELISRLRRDHKSGFSEARDVLAGHALPVALYSLANSWFSLRESTLRILIDDLEEIDSELKHLDATYPSAPNASELPANFEASLIAKFGKPDSPRAATTYAGFLTGGTIAVIPNGSQFQTVSMIAFGLCTYIDETLCVRDVLLHTGADPAYNQLCLELVVADFMALLEIVYTGVARNEYGPTGLNLVSLWASENHAGLTDLQSVRSTLPENNSDWIELRNTVCCHVDADIPIDDLELSNWKVPETDIEQTSLQFVNLLRASGFKSMKTRLFALPPQQLQGISGLVEHSERFWDDTKS